MKLVIVCLYDQAVEAYSSLHTARTIDEAKRGFINGILQEGSLLNRNFKDFSLIQVGEFNDHDGMPTPLIPPKVICTGLEINKVVQIENLRATDPGKAEVLEDLQRAEKAEQLQAG